MYVKKKQKQSSMFLLPLKGKVGINQDFTKKSLLKVLGTEQILKKKFLKEFYKYL